MIGLLLAAMLLAIVGVQLHVIDERGASVAAATVVFRSAADATSTETTDKAGQVAVPATLDPASVTVSAPGYETASITLSAGTTSAVPAAALDSVAIATSSAQIRSNVARTQSEGTTLTYTTPVARCTRLRAYLTSQYARITEGPVYDIGNGLQYVPSRAGDVC